jgi:hypothetical protein
MRTHKFAEAVVTDRAVFFDGEELPWHIAKDGIQYQPDPDFDIGRLHITFLVDSVEFKNEVKQELRQLEHDAAWTHLNNRLSFRFYRALLAFESVERSFGVRD